MPNDNRSDIEKLSEGLAIKFILIKFVEFIKSEYQLCNNIEFFIDCGVTKNNPNTEYLVNKFLKEQVERIIKKKPDDAYSTGHI